MRYQDLDVNMDMYRHDTYRPFVMAGMQNTARKTVPDNRNMRYYDDKDNSMLREDYDRGRYQNYERDQQWNHADQRNQTPVSGYGRNRDHSFSNSSPEDHCYSPNKGRGKMYPNNGNGYRKYNNRGIRSSSPYSFRRHYDRGRRPGRGSRGRGRGRGRGRRSRKGRGEQNCSRSETFVHHSSISSPEERKGVHVPLKENINTSLSTVSDKASKATLNLKGIANVSCRKPLLTEKDKSELEKSFPSQTGKLEGSTPSFSLLTDPVGRLLSEDCRSIEEGECFETSSEKSVPPVDKSRTNSGGDRSREGVISDRARSCDSAESNYKENSYRHGYSRDRRHSTQDRNVSYDSQSPSADRRDKGYGSRADKRTRDYSPERDRGRKPKERRSSSKDRGQDRHSYSRERSYQHSGRHEYSHSNKASSKDRESSKEKDRKMGNDYQRSVKSIVRGGIEKKGLSANKLANKYLQKVTKASRSKPKKRDNTANTSTGSVADDHSDQNTTIESTDIPSDTSPVQIHTFEGTVELFSIDNVSSSQEKVVGTNANVLEQKKKQTLHEKKETESNIEMGDKKEKTTSEQAEDKLPWKARTLLISSDSLKKMDELSKGPNNKISKGVHDSSSQENAKESCSSNGRSEHSSLTNSCKSAAEKKTDIKGKEHGDVLSTVVLNRFSSGSSNKKTPSGNDLENPSGPPLKSEGPGVTFESDKGQKKPDTLSKKVKKCVVNVERDTSMKIQNSSSYPKQRREIRTSTPKKEKINVKTKELLEPGVDPKRDPEQSWLKTTDKNTGTVQLLVKQFDIVTAEHGSKKCTPAKETCSQVGSKVEDKVHIKSTKSANIEGGIDMTSSGEIDKPTHSQPVSADAVKAEDKTVKQNAMQNDEKKVQRPVAAPDINHSKRDRKDDGTPVQKGPSDNQNVSKSDKSNRSSAAMSKSNQGNVNQVDERIKDSKIERKMQAARQVPSKKAKEAKEDSKVGKTPEKETVLLSNPKHSHSIINQVDCHMIDNKIASANQPEQHIKSENDTSLTKNAVKASKFMNESRQGKTVKPSESRHDSRQEKNASTKPTSMSGHNLKQHTGCSTVDSKPESERQTDGHIASKGDQSMTKQAVNDPETRQDSKSGKSPEQTVATLLTSKGGNHSSKENVVCDRTDIKTETSEQAKELNFSEGDKHLHNNTVKASTSMQDARQETSSSTKLTSKSGHSLKQQPDCNSTHSKTESVGQSAGLRASKSDQTKQTSKTLEAKQDSKSGQPEKNFVSMPTSKELVDSNITESKTVSVNQADGQIHHESKEPLPKSFLAASDTKQVRKDNMHDLSVDLKESKSDKLEKKEDNVKLFSKTRHSSKTQADYARVSDNLAVQTPSQKEEPLNGLDSGMKPAKKGQMNASKSDKLASANKKGESKDDEHKVVAMHVSKSRHNSIDRSACKEEDERQINYKDTDLETNGTSLEKVKPDKKGQKYDNMFDKVNSLDNRQTLKDTLDGMGPSAKSGSKLHSRGKDQIDCSKFAAVVVFEKQKVLNHTENTAEDNMQDHKYGLSNVVYATNHEREKEGKDSGEEKPNQRDVIAIAQSFKPKASDWIPKRKSHDKPRRPSVGDEANAPTHPLSLDTNHDVVGQILSRGVFQRVSTPDGKQENKSFTSSRLSECENDKTEGDGNTKVGKSFNNDSSQTRSKETNMASTKKDALNKLRVAAAHESIKQKLKKKGAVHSDKASNERPTEKSDPNKGTSGMKSSNNIRKTLEKTSQLILTPKQFKRHKSGDSSEPKDLATSDVSRELQQVSMLKGGQSQKDREDDRNAKKPRSRHSTQERSPERKRIKFDCENEKAGHCQADENYIMEANSLKNTESSNKKKHAKSDRNSTDYNDKIHQTMSKPEKIREDEQKKKRRHSSEGDAAIGLQTNSGQSQEKRKCLDGIESDLICPEKKEDLKKACRILHSKLNDSVKKMKRLSKETDVSIRTEGKDTATCKEAEDKMPSLSLNISPKSTKEDSVAESCLQFSTSDKGNTDVTCYEPNFCVQTSEFRQFSVEEAAATTAKDPNSVFSRRISASDFCRRFDLDEDDEDDIRPLDLIDEIDVSSDPTETSREFISPPGTHFSVPDLYNPMPPLPTELHPSQAPGCQTNNEEASHFDNSLNGGNFTLTSIGKIFLSENEDRDLPLKTHAKRFLHKSKNWPAPVYSDISDEEEEELKSFADDILVSNIRKECTDTTVILPEEKCVGSSCPKAKQGPSQPTPGKVRFGDKLEKAFADLEENVSVPTKKEPQGKRITFEKLERKPTDNEPDYSDDDELASYFDTLGSSSETKRPKSPSNSEDDVNKDKVKACEVKPKRLSPKFMTTKTATCNSSSHLCVAKTTEDEQGKDSISDLCTDQEEASKKTQDLGFIISIAESAVAPVTPLLSDSGTMNEPLPGTSNTNPTPPESGKTPPSPNCQSHGLCSSNQSLQNITRNVATNQKQVQSVSGVFHSGLPMVVHNTGKLTKPHSQCSADDSHLSDSRINKSVVPATDLEIMRASYTREKTDLLPETRPTPVMPGQATDLIKNTEKEQICPAKLTILQTDERIQEDGPNGGALDLSSQQPSKPSQLLYSPPLINVTGKPVVLSVQSNQDTRDAPLLETGSSHTNSSSHLANTKPSIISDVKTSYLKSLCHQDNHSTSPDSLHNQQGRILSSNISKDDDSPDVIRQEKEMELLTTLKELYGINDPDPDIGNYLLGHRLQLTSLVEMKKKCKKKREMRISPVPKT